MWFDGACGEGPNGKQQVYDWRAYWKLIRELAPMHPSPSAGRMYAGAATKAGLRARASGVLSPCPAMTNRGKSPTKRYRASSAISTATTLEAANALMRSRTDHPVLAWYPSQVNTSIRPGWFYHKYEDGRVRSLKELLTIYYGSVGGNGQFLLNIPPDRRGPVP